MEQLKDMAVQGIGLDQIGIYSSSHQKFFRIFAKIGPISLVKHIPPVQQGDLKNYCIKLRERGSATQEKTEIKNS